MLSCSFVHIPGTQPKRVLGMGGFPVRISNMAIGCGPVEIPICFGGVCAGDALDSLQRTGFISAMTPAIQITLSSLCQLNPQWYFFFFNAGRYFYKSQA